MNSFFLFYSPIPYPFLFLSLSHTHTILKNVFLQSSETVSCNRKDIITQQLTSFPEQTLSANHMKSIAAD